MSASRGQKRGTGRINDYVGHRLQKIRKARGLSCSETARRAGIPAGSYSCLENGWYRISLDNLFRILQVLKAEVTDIWPAVDGSLKEPIDSDSVLAAVRQAGTAPSAEINLDSIVDACSRAFEIQKRLLTSGSRRPAAQDARAACGLLVQETPSLSMKSLCGYLGVNVSRMSRLLRTYRDELGQESEFLRRLKEARRRVTGVRGK